MTTYTLSDITDAMGKAMADLSIKDKATADRQLRIYTDRIIEILKGKGK